MSKQKLIEKIIISYPLLNTGYLDDIGSIWSAESLDDMMGEALDCRIEVEDQEILEALQHHDEAILQIINTGLGMLYPTVGDFWSFLTVISHGENAIKLAEIILLLPLTSYCTKNEHKEMLNALSDVCSVQYVNYLLKILKISPIREALIKSGIFGLSLKALATALILKGEDLNERDTLRVLTGVTSGRINHTNVQTLRLDTLPRAFIAPQCDILEAVTSGVVKTGMSEPHIKARHQSFGVSEALDNAARLVLELDRSRQRDEETKKILGYLPRHIEMEASILPASYRYWDITEVDVMYTAKCLEKERLKILGISHWEDRCPSTYVFPSSEVPEDSALTDTVTTPVLRTFNYQRQAVKGILKPISKTDIAIIKTPSLLAAEIKDEVEMTLPTILEALDKLIASASTVSLGGAIENSYIYTEARVKRRRLS